MARSSLTPGFRFHPTDVELVMYYLKRKLLKKKLIVDAVAEVNIYDFSPWDLPDKSNLRSGDLEWFFLCPKARKYLSGSRANRATETGFWKATGKDRAVEYKQRTVAMIKTLVFHLGHAPKGQRTDWVMHEYRMEDEHLANAGIVQVQDMYVLCKIFEKSGAGPKNGAQYGAPFNEEEWDDDVVSCSECPAVVGPDGTTNTMNCKQNGPATMHMTVPQGTRSLSLTEPGSSTITSSANERRIDVPANDDAMLTVGDIASIMGVSTQDFTRNNTKEGVEVANEKEVMPNEDDGIYDDLVNLINLDDLSEVASNKFKIDRADYTLDAIFRVTADDLDADLRGFYVE